jgi:hypothetical protein
MTYLGNCVDSFDADGECTNPYLPWSDVNEFACAVDEDDNCTVGNVEIRYDAENDIHSFYRLTA